MSMAVRALTMTAVVFGQSLLPFVPAAARQQGTSLQASARPHVIVLAHRGCWGKVPEVSVSAILNCQLVGADEVEIDVRESRDGILILMHDDTVDRTTDGTGRVADLTAAQIHALHLKTGGGGADATLTSEHVPTLEEGLAAARGKVLVNLHLKVPVEARVAAVVRRMKMEGRVTTWVTAAPDDPQLLRSPLKGAIGIIPTINECGPQYPQPCWTQPIRSLRAFGPIRPVAFFLDFRQTHSFISAVSNSKRPAGSRIFVETLNNIDVLPRDERHAEWRRLIDMGVSIIMTNEPGDLIDFLKTIPFKGRPSDANPLLKPIAKN